MDLQKVSNFFDCTGLSFRRTPESGNIEYFLDAGGRRHNGEQTFTRFCDAIAMNPLTVNRMAEQLIFRRNAASA
jgi:hypothetical protein